MMKHKDQNWTFKFPECQVQHVWVEVLLWLKHSVYSKR